MKYLQAKQIHVTHQNKDYVIGREITTLLKIAMNKDIAAFTLLRDKYKIVFTTPVYLQFCMDFVRIYCI